MCIMGAEGTAKVDFQPLIPKQHVMQPSMRYDTCLTQPYHVQGGEGDSQQL